MLPEPEEHTVAPPALGALARADELERALSAACGIHPPKARTLAALGNAMLRRGAYLDALEAYRSASDLDPSDAPLAWMCAEIAYVLDNTETSVRYRARALGRQRLFLDPLPVGDRTPVLLLLRDAPYSVNTPLELVLDRSRVAIHKLYVEGEAAMPLPDVDAVFTAFGFAHAAGRAVANAARFTDTINDPHALERTSREAVGAWANSIAGIRAPACEIVTQSDLGRVTLPATIRPIDTHAGDGFALIASREELDLWIERSPADAYYVAPFIDYRSADGFYRKFRAIFVDGVAYPYHHATSLHWMVHYKTAPMQSVSAFREEEARFLADPAAFVPQWERVMPEIARTVGLDYFGIDAAAMPSGDLVLFEADAAMLVHDEDARGVFAFKRPYVARIREALHALIARRTRRRTL